MYLDDNNNTSSENLSDSNNTTVAINDQLNNNINDQNINELDNISFNENSFKVKGCVNHFPSSPLTSFLSIFSKSDKIVEKKANVDNLSKINITMCRCFDPNDQSSLKRVIYSGLGLGFEDKINSLANGIVEKVSNNNISPRKKNRNRKLSSSGKMENIFKIVTDN
jgi:hypothetical protein